MKKTILILTLCLGVAFGVNAQISTGSLQNVVKTASTVASAARIDVNSVSSSIMSKLTSKLNLTSAQSPKVLEAVTSFLQSKSSILTLANTDKAKYTAKLSDLTAGLQSKIKTAVTAAQFASFLKLKPTTNTPTNVLSQLFY